MAKRKQDVLVQVMAPYVRVWVDSPERYVDEINQIEGVNNARLPIAACGFIDVMVDPRYELYEVAEDIKQLLSAEVPDIFKDQTE